MSDARDRIIVALDVPTIQDVCQLVRELSGLVGGFKVGLELLTTYGGKAVMQVIRSENVLARVFYDGKFADIPNTVGAAARAASALGVWAFNVHASAGRKAMESAVANKGNSLVLAVTVLTSLDDIDCDEVFSVPPIRKAVEFATYAAQAGCDGVVCSPKELKAICADENTAKLLTVVPGIRPAWAAAEDQARVMTPGEAVRAGADCMVIGRPITQPPAGIGSPREAVERIVEEIEEAMGDV